MNTIHVIAPNFVPRILKISNYLNGFYQIFFQVFVCKIRRGDSKWFRLLHYLALHFHQLWLPVPLEGGGEVGRRGKASAGVMQEERVMGERENQSSRASTVCDAFLRMQQDGIIDLIVVVDYHALYTYSVFSYAIQQEMVEYFV